MAMTNNVTGDGGATGDQYSPVITPPPPPLPPPRSLPWSGRCVNAKAIIQSGTAVYEWMRTEFYYYYYMYKLYPMPAEYKFSFRVRDISSSCSSSSLHVIQSVLRIEWLVAAFHPGAAVIQVSYPRRRVRLRRLAWGVNTFQRFYPGLRRFVWHVCIFIQLKNVDHRLIWLLSWTRKKKWGRKLHYSPAYLFSSLFSLIFIIVFVYVLVLFSLFKWWS